MEEDVGSYPGCGDLMLPTPIDEETNSIFEIPVVTPPIFPPLTLPL
jgi:hypothetical protein